MKNLNITLEEVLKTSIKNTYLKYERKEGKK
jgi:hypothetical protein